jgi:hypothetical protein
VRLSAESGFKAGEQRFDIALNAVQTELGVNRERASPRPLDRRRHLAGGGPISGVVDGNPRTLGRQLRRDRPANPPGGTRDQSRLPCQIRHLISFRFE